VKTRVFLFVLIVLLGVIPGRAQHANIWYFGAFAGMDFNGGPPVPIFNSAMSMIEGTASIADRNTGQILFYTNGMSVWDATHTIMSNGTGLLGNSSATQSAMIVPQPGNDSIYFIFTVGSGSADIHYSKVNMNKNGGLGEVDNTTKNTFLVSPVCEKLTASLHANGQDIWVLSHGYNNSNFYAWLVTASGVNSVPVTTSIGPSVTFYIGQMKVSPDGNTIGMVTSIMAQPMVADFNSATGVVSNVIVLPSSGQEYGCAFSGNSQYFYTGWINSGWEIMQYDVSSMVSATVIASETKVGNNGRVIASMQLGPDGKIYTTKSGLSELGVINDPDQPGMACNFDSIGFNLGGPVCRLGLPSFIQSYFVNSEFIYQNTCLGDTTVFTTVVDTGLLDSAVWSFDDPASGAFNASRNFNTYHIFTDTGSYEVRLIVYGSSTSDTFVSTVQINGYPVVNLGGDTTICQGDSVTLDAGNPGANFNWGHGPTTQTATVYNTWDYDVGVTLNGCTSYDTVSVIVQTPFSVAIGPDQQICYGESVTLDAGNPGMQYTWSTGDTTQTTTFSDTGSFIVTVTNGVCTVSDTMQVTYKPSPAVDLGNDTAFCEGGSLTLDAQNPGSIYTWSTTESTQTINVTTSGTYWVEASLAGCLHRDTVEITVVPLPVVNLRQDTSICGVANIVLDAGGGMSSYQWTTGDTTQQITVTQTGIYSVTVSNGTCESQDEFELEIQTIPEPDIGGVEYICQFQSVQVVGGAYAAYHWSTGESSPSITVADPSLIWLVVEDANGCPSDTAYKPIMGKDCPTACDSVVFVPNAFTPDAFTNNVLAVRGIPGVRIRSFMVFNRWGEVVFERREFFANDYTMGWDGTYKGERLPPQAFAYFVHVECDGQEVVMKSGSVTLLR
jgi:gliding motility-associated-like protein